MVPKNNHSRILLSNNNAGAIAYYENCDVVELEMDAISIRVNGSSLAASSDLIGNADKCLCLIWAQEIKKKCKQYFAYNKLSLHI